MKKFFLLLFLSFRIFADEIVFHEDADVLFADKNYIYFGKDEGVERLDLDTGKKEILDIKGKVRDIKKCGNSVCILFEKDGFFFLRDIDLTIDLEIKNDVNEFIEQNGIFYLFSKYNGILEIKDNKISVISSSNPFWKNSYSGELNNFFAAGTGSLDIQNNFIFLYSYEMSEIFMINNNFFRTVVSSNSYMIKNSTFFIPEKDIHYPLYFLPLFFNKNSKLQVAQNGISFYFSFENLLFFVDFSGFYIFYEADDYIADFYITENDKYFLLRKLEF